MNIRRSTRIGSGLLTFFLFLAASAQTMPIYDTDGQWRACLSQVDLHPEIASTLKIICDGLHNGEPQIRDFLNKHWNEYAQSQRLWCIANPSIKTYDALRECIEHGRMDLRPNLQPRQ